MTTGSDERIIEYWAPRHMEDVRGRSALYNRFEAALRDRNEATTPTKAYPWQAAASQVAGEVLVDVQQLVAEAWARPVGNHVNVIVLTVNQAYSHGLALALGELEARLRRLLAKHYIDVGVEMLPNWSASPNDLESVRHQAVQIA